MLISRGYAELGNYNFVMEDLMTKGTHFYIISLNRARSWNNRVLGMLQEIRQISAKVAEIAQGKSRLFDTAVGDWLVDQKRAGTLPKGIDSTERRALARRSCQTQEEAIERWDALKNEVKAYIDCLQDKQKDLANVKEDLRTQLWAVRVHGVLMEFARDGQKGTFSRDPDSSQSANATPLPYDSEPEMAEGLPIAEPLSEDPDITTLLGGGN